LPASVKLAVRCLFVELVILFRELRNEGVDGVVEFGFAVFSGPEMISGVRASSIRMESTSSTMAKLCPRCTIGAVVFHVVAQIVEAEFVVGAVGDVAA
jgi:hypothetical protein